jgi:hypothetical protein
VPSNHWVLKLKSSEFVENICLILLNEVQFIKFCGFRHVFLLLSFNHDAVSFNKFYIADIRFEQSQPKNDKEISGNKSQK